MRSRIGCGIALGLLAGLGGTGCATSKPRPEAPPQFRTWNPPAASKSANGASVAPIDVPKGTGPTASKVAPANRPVFPWAEPTGPTKTTLSGWNWRFKPGSLFRKPTKPAGPAAPAATPTGTDGSLAKFFPGLYGQNAADPARLATARRPPQAPRLGDGTVVTTRATRPSAPVSDDVVSTLPIAIEARAYPGAPSSLTDGMTRLARRDRPSPADEQLTSHEEGPAPSGPRPRPQARPRGSDPTPGGSSMDDAITAELGDAPAPTTPRPRASTADPAARPTSAGVRVPAGALRLATAGPAAVEDERDGPDLKIEPLRAVPSTRPRTTVSTPAERPKADAVAAKFPTQPSRPRIVRALPMELPPPEFPATYHTESLRQVLRERGPGMVDVAARPASAEKVETWKPVLMPWLAKLWTRPAVDDNAVTPTSARREVPGTRPIGTIASP